MSLNARIAALKLLVAEEPMSREEIEAAILEIEATILALPGGGD